MNEPAGPPPLVAAPRHLHKRAFRAEISDTLMVPGASPLIPAAESRAERLPQPTAKESAQTARRRKRLVALVILILVSLSIPAFVLALILGG